MKLAKISEGAESYIYSTNFLGFDAVLKRRIKKDYRLSEIDEDIRVERTKNEARIMGFVSSLEINSPKVMLVDKYDIYMNRLYGKNLNAILDSKEIIDKKLFATLGKYAALLHNNRVAHGDYTPANFIVDKTDKIHLIDFGLSEMTDSLEEKALDILLMKRSINKNHFGLFITAYKKECNEGNSILKRLAKIEKMGRYNTRTLIT